MSYAIRTDHFTGNDLIIFHFIYLERLGSSKMLKYVSIIISHCYFISETSKYFLLILTHTGNF